jgi:(p)ppGpp synthase/HD superfamily hydrolase
MNIIEKSIQIALNAHKGQIDKAGKPYILHPLRLMFQLEDEIGMIAAVLHDVVEDSDITLEDLRKEGIPEEAVEIIGHLTRDPEESYDNFIQRISGNRKAIRVKIKDLEDNMDFSRLSVIEQKDMERLVRYHKALSFLKRYL